MIFKFNNKEFECEINVQKLLKSYKLDASDLSQEYNMYWDQDHMEKDKRGSLDYYFPRGWYGYKINIFDKS